MTFPLEWCPKAVANFEFHRRLFGNLERKNTKRKTKKKRTRGLGKVNQPHKIGGMGLGNMNQPHQVGKTMRKRMKPGRTQKDLLKKNPKIPEIFGVFLGTPGSRGERVETAVFGTDSVAGPATCFSSEVFSCEENSEGNPLSTSDGSSYYCPQGCPGRDRVSGAIAMAGSTFTPKIAAVRMGHKGERDSDYEPRELPELWEEKKFEEPPKYNKDEWLDCWLEKGWLVRSHGKSRIRRFHPVHKGIPIHVDNLEGGRVTIGFNNMGEKVTVKDRWTDAPTNHFCPKQSWKGWTFLRLKQPMRSNLGERFAVAAMQGGSEAAGSTFGGAGERASKSEPVVRELPNYTKVSDPEPFPEKSEPSKDDEGFWPMMTRGYNKGTTVEKGQFVAAQIWKPPGLEEESDEDWEKVSETP